MLVAFLLFFNLLYVGAFFIALLFGTFTSFGLALALLVAMPGVSGILFEQTSRAALSPKDHKSLTDWSRATLTDQAVVLRTGWATYHWGPLSFPYPVCLLIWQDNETTLKNGKVTLILRHKIVTPECTDIQNILRQRAARLLWPNWPMALLSSFTLTFVRWIAPGLTPKFHICEDIQFNTEYTTASVHERLQILSQAQRTFKTLKFSTTPMAVL